MSDNALKKLTPQMITDEYLHGRNGRNLTVDADYYMKTAGRFASPSQIKILDVFFNHWMHKDSTNIPAGEYTKEQMQKILKLENIPENSHKFHQAMYADNKDDRIERAYIWGTTSIKISNNARFVIEPNGNRYLKNFALVPMEENFDFQGNWLSNIANQLFLQNAVDPNNQGKTVFIKFYNGNIKLHDFTYQDYIKSQSKYKHQTLPLEKINPIEIKQFLDSLSSITHTKTSSNEINKPIPLLVDEKDESYQYIKSKLALNSEFNQLDMQNQDKLVRQEIENHNKEIFAQAKEQAMELMKNQQSQIQSRTL
ncbi:MAG: hypothetical protein RLZZ210_258 [Pseudomonadota bacterium]|jgi:hypothetical protein